MKNQDKPAYPFKSNYPHDNESASGYMGLTKREEFARSAMMGLLSNPAQIGTTDYEWIASHAIGYADELLKQLES